MNVEKMMTSNPACAPKSAMINEIAKMMRDRDCGMIPIVDEKNAKKVIGTVTDRDIACRAVADGKSPTETSAADVMTSEVISCRADASDEQAEDLMEKHQLRRIIVTDAKGQLVGVLAQADIAKHQGRADAGKVVREISKD